MCDRCVPTKSCPATGVRAHPGASTYGLNPDRNSGPRCDSRICTGCVPALLERGLARAAAEGLDIDFRERETPRIWSSTTRPSTPCCRVSESCLRPTGSRPRPSSRVCVAPGGPSRSPTGRRRASSVTCFEPWARMFRPAGVKPPGLWGTEDRLRELFGGGLAPGRRPPELCLSVSLAAASRRLLPCQFRHSPPALEALDERRQRAPSRRSGGTDDRAQPRHRRAGDSRRVPRSRRPPPIAQRNYLAACSIATCARWTVLVPHFSHSLAP
jgi:hypothetical protein